MNESINGSINESMNQYINQSINQSIMEWEESHRDLVIRHCKECHDLRRFSSPPNVAIRNIIFVDSLERTIRQFNVASRTRNFKKFAFQIWCASKADALTDGYTVDSSHHKYLPTKISRLVVYSCCSFFSSDFIVCLVPHGLVGA